MTRKSPSPRPSARLWSVVALAGPLSALLRIEEIKDRLDELDAIEKRLGRGR